MKNAFWGIVWLFVLILFSFFVAGFCAWWYIICLPFTVCCEDCTKLTDILLQGVQFPHYCAKAMVECRAP